MSRRRAAACPRHRRSRRRQRPTVCTPACLCVSTRHAVSPRSVLARQGSSQKQPQARSRGACARSA
eukprot:6860118-Prymnesium_polylepis.2